MAGGARRSQNSKAADDVDSDAITFFRYVDETGRDVVTNEYESIPADARARTEVLDLKPTPEATASVPAAPLDLGSLHGPSVLVGAVVGGLLVGLAFGLRRSRLLLRVIVLAGVVGTLGAAYFGWAMRSAGLSEATFANPSQAVDEARAVRDQANARQAAQKALERELDTP